MAVSSSERVRASAALRRQFLTLLPIFSIGLRSGEWAGKKRTLAPTAASIRASVFGAFVGNQVVHDRHVAGPAGSTERVAHGPRGRPACRSHSRWSCSGSNRPGAPRKSWSWSASGRAGPWRADAARAGARPRRRVMFVFAPASSRKTRRAGSKPFRAFAARASTRLRLRATSGRSCSLARSVFFCTSAPSSPARGGWPRASSAGRWPRAVAPKSGRAACAPGCAAGAGGSGGPWAAARPGGPAGQSGRCAAAGPTAF